MNEGKQEGALAEGARRAPQGLMSVFADAAVRLARNPLGIIGLAFVLVYGMAGLVATSAAFRPQERFFLVWFLIGFPVLVLFAFYRLVTRHHGKLYAPSDFKEDASFIRLSGDVERAKKEISETKIADKDLTFWMARVNYFDGDYQSAHVLYDSILKKEPDNVEALIGKGASLIRITKAQEWAVRQALANCTRIIDSLDPKEPLAWYNRACYRWLLRESEAAVLEDLRRSVSLNPSTFKEWIQKDLLEGGQLVGLRDAILRDPELAPHVPQG